MMVLMMAEMVLKVVTGKTVGGWLEAGRMSVSGSTVEARDKYGELQRALPCLS